MSAAALKIKVFDAKGTHNVQISKSTATIGSADHCDVVLKHVSVQPEHIRAWVDGGRIWVQDMSSASGTSLNGVRLPALKPMLVRELDVLKLGECPATLGFEPNLVRAPVVKAPMRFDEITATDINIKPLNPNDLETVSRELADLKLQLQMAKLEKDTGEELRKEVSNMKNEIERLGTEKQKLADSFQMVDSDKKTYKKKFENEVADLKLKALRELKEQREEDQRKFEHWKSDLVAKLSGEVRTLSDQKVKTWATRPISKDMIFEWEADLNQMFRRAVLNDNAGASPVRRGSVTNVPIPQPIPKPEKKEEVTGVHANPKTATNIKRPRPAAVEPWARYTMGGLVFAAALLALWWGSAYFRKTNAPRSIAGTESLPSTAAVARPQAVPPQVPQPPQAQNPYSSQQQQLQNQNLAQVRGQGMTTPGFKKTYTENVLFTSNFVDSELNMDFRAMWLKDLKKAARDWKIDDKALNMIASKEIVLIQDLQRMRSSPEQMRARESQFTRDIQPHLGKKGSVEKFMKLKRAFYTRNQVYLVRENR